VVGRIVGAPALPVAGVAVRVGADAAVDLEAAARAALAVAAGRGGADADHVLVDGRVTDGAGVLVAGGREDDHAGVIGVGEGRIGGAVATDRRTQAQADHVGAIVGGPVERVLDVAEVHAAGAVGDLAGHDAGVGGDPHRTDAVEHRGGDAGAGGAVAGAAGVVVGIGIVVAEVVAGHQAQIGMASVHTRIEDGDHHAGAAVSLRRIPGLLGPGVEAGRADLRTGLRVGVPVIGGQLAGVVVAPVVRVERVAGNGHGEGAPVEGDRVDAVEAAQAIGHRGEVLIGLQAQQEPAVHSGGRAPGLIVGALDGRESGAAQGVGERIEDRGGRPVEAGPAREGQGGQVGRHLAGGELHEQAVGRVGLDVFDRSRETVLHGHKRHGIGGQGGAETGHEDHGGHDQEEALHGGLLTVREGRAFRPHEPSTLNK